MFWAYLTVFLNHPVCFEDYPELQLCFQVVVLGIAKGLVVLCPGVPPNTSWKCRLFEIESYPLGLNRHDNRMKISIADNNKNAFLKQQNCFRILFLHFSIQFKDSIHFLLFVYRPIYYLYNVRPKLNILYIS